MALLHIMNILFIGSFLKWGEGAVLLSRHMPTNQSSLYSPGRESYKANDGSYNLMAIKYDNGTNFYVCSATLNETLNYWLVDLRRNYIINYIIIYNRNDSLSKRLLSARVIIISNDGNAKEISILGSDQKIYNISGGNNIGRYVKIEKAYTILSFCEVDVFGENITTTPASTTETTQLTTLTTTTVSTQATTTTPKITTTSKSTSSQTTASQTTSSPTTLPQTTTSQTTTSQTTSSPTTLPQTTTSQTTTSQTKSSPTTLPQTTTSQSTTSQTTSSPTTLAQSTSSQTTASQTTTSQSTASQTTTSQTISSQTPTSQAKISETTKPSTASSTTISTQRTNSSNSITTTTLSQASTSSSINSQSSQKQPFVTTTSSPIGNSSLTLPFENLLNIKYSATTSHHWYFTNNIINDQGSSNNFLIIALQQRSNNNDPSLKPYFQSTNISYFNPVGVNPFPAGFTNDTSLFQGDSPSLSFPGNGQCMELFDISTDHAYNKACLSEPEKCEYGFSVALWFKYNEDTIRTKDTFMASGPQGTQGFEFSYQLGYLNVTITGRMNSWTAQMPVMKYVGIWSIIGFSWISSSGEIRIIAGDSYLTIPGTKVNHNMNYNPATKVYLGCLRQLSGYVDHMITPKISIAHAAMWMWPIRLKELFPSEFVYQMIVLNPTASMTTTTVIPPIVFDFSQIINELVGITNDPNPYYSSSDAYFSVSNTPFDPNNIAVIQSPRPGFQLKGRNSKINLQKPTKFINRCPCIFTACNSGLSVSFWILIPKDATKGDVFVIMNNLRIMYSENSFTIIVYNGSKIMIRKTSSPIKADIWQNFGFTITPDSQNLDIYINGYLDSGAQMTNPSPQLDLQKYNNDVNVSDILIGSGAGDSLEKAIINDVTMWRRYLFPFESHRFVGYTSSQFKQLATSTNYWTTDTYINNDASYQLSIRTSQTKIQMAPFSLSTLLKPNSAQFFMDMDPFSKSSGQCPLLLQQSTNYLFLARSKILRSTYMNSDISWDNICLTDPTNTQCRMAGVTISLWMKIKSVSFNKIQFFLSTGDLANSLGSNDGRGISIFVNRMLFGISVSTSTKDWDIILDSNKYRIDEWMNIGILWREDIGLQMMINGVDYGLRTSIPNQRFKSKDTGVRAVIGRFDTDAILTWNTQSTWEFSNFVFGEMSYLESYITPDNYSSMIGMVNNIFYADATWIRQGEALINSPIKDLLKAKNISQNLNYKGRVEWDEHIQAVRILSARVPILVDTTKCPGVLSSCTSGFSIGGWFLINQEFKSSLTNKYSLMMYGIETSDSFGVQLRNTNELYGWTRIATSLWSIVVPATSLTGNLSEWIFIGLMWRNDSGVILVVNGNNYPNSSVTLVSSVQTTSSRVFIGDNSTSFPSKKGLLVYNIVFYNYLLNFIQMQKLLGIQYNQVSLLSRSTLFWTVYGLYYKLIESRVVLRGVTTARNKYDIANGAVCTNGADQSFIELKASTIHCLNQPNLCQSFVLTINMKIYPLVLPGQRDGYILLSGQERTGYTGVTIIQDSSNKTIIEIRDPSRTCQTSITNYRFNEWIQVQVIWNTSKNPTIKINALIVAIAGSASCKTEDNKLSQTSSILLGHHPTLTLAANQICLSELMLMVIDKGIDPENASIGLYDNSCYTNMDLIFPLSLDQSDQYQQFNGASQFKDAVINYTFTDNSINIPSTCFNGFTLSVWVNINSISGNDVVLLNIGGDTRQGVRFKLQSNSGPGGYDLLINLDTGLKQWVLKQNAAIPKGLWTNVGITWNNQTGLVLFINGLVAQMVTTYSPSSVTNTTLARSIDIGKQIDGTISDLVIWYKIVASCLNPRDSNAILNGFCTRNITLPVTQKCNFLPDCKNISGNLCIDETISNVQRVAASSMTLTAPLDSNLVLQMVNNVLKRSDSNLNLTKAAVVLLLNVARNMIIPDSLTNSAASDLIDAFVNVNAEIMLDKYMNDWVAMQNQNFQVPPSVIKETDAFYLKVSTKLTSICVPLSIVRQNLGISLLTYNARNDKCQSVQLPNYPDIPWSKYPDVWTGLGNSFTIKQSTIQTTQPIISVSSTIYNSKNIMPSNANPSIPAGLVVNSQIINVNTNPPLSQTPGKTLVRISLKFTNPNIRQGIYLPWDSVESPNPDLKYQWVPVFWNDSLMLTTPSFGAWDINGCTARSWNSTNVVFRCDHLTSFSILMQPVVHMGNYLQILNIITYIGLAISLICLLIFIITIAISKDLRGIRYIIHLNMSCSLLVACISLLLTGPAQQNQIFCRAVGVIMHLFFLATFMWMFFEALYVFYAVTSGIYTSRLKCFFPIGWGIPIVIVATTAGLNVDAYGRNTYCWLSLVDYYIWAFLGPLLILIVSTVIVSLIVACNLTTPAIKGEVLIEARDNIKQTAFTIPLMLFGWLFGVVFMLTMNIPVAFLFVILCSLQGLWVLIFFGLMNPDFRHVLCRKGGKRERPASAINIINSMENEYNSESNVQDQRVAKPPPKTSAPIYYVTTPKPRPPRHVGSVEHLQSTNNSQRNLIEPSYEEADEIQTMTLQNNGIPENYSRSIPGTPQYQE